MPPKGGYLKVDDEKRCMIIAFMKDNCEAIKLELSQKVTVIDKSKAWDQLFEYQKSIGGGFKCKKALQQQYQDWKSKMIGKRNKRNRTGEGKQQEMHQYEKMLEEFLYGRFANTTVSVSIFVFVIL